MRGGGFSHRRVRRFDGAAANAFPRFDLLNDGGQRDALLTRLNALPRAVFDQSAGRLRQLFHVGRVALSAGHWSSISPVAEFWLRAQLRQRPDAVVWLGLEGVALFALSDLFFGNGGSAGGGQRDHVSDTEERIATRLLRCQLEEIATALGLAGSDWSICWEAAGPQGPLPSCRVTFAADSLECGWTLCWMAEPAPEATPVVLTPPTAEAIEQAVLQVPVRLRVEVADLEIALGRLEGLRTGDVLPLNLHGEAMARIGGVSCCQGRVAEDGEALVLQITKVFGQKDAW